MFFRARLTGRRGGRRPRTATTPTCDAPAHRARELLLGCGEEASVIFRVLLYLLLMLGLAVRERVARPRPLA